MINRKEKRTAKIGFFSVVHAVYFDQFPGLEDNLKKYHADKLILSVDGITPENGLTTFYNREVELDKVMLSHSATRIIAADSTKLGRTAFAKIADVTEADYIITNSDMPNTEEMEQLKQLIQHVIMV